MSLNPDTTTQEYIEVIHDLEQEFKVARVKDIADRRGVTRSSVSIALNQLAKKNLITHEQYGHVSLTTLGKELANDLLRKHQIIKEFLVSILGIDEDEADTDACTLEHHVSPVTLSALTDFVNFIQKCPGGWKLVVDSFQNCTTYGDAQQECDNCTANIKNLL